MVTFFGTAKRFEGLNGLIQRNAILSWKRLVGDCEIVIFTSENDENLKKVADEFNIRLIEDAECNEYGTIYVDYMFDRIQEVSDGDLFCYINCDIILMNNFLGIVGEINNALKQGALVVGRRTDLDVKYEIDFLPGWERKLSERSGCEGKLHAATGIDYMVFPRGYLKGMPKFAVGRTCWDNYIIYRAKKDGLPVVDASSIILAIHQNHDYGHHPKGKKGIWKGDEARTNESFTNGKAYMLDIRDADYGYSKCGLEKNGVLSNIARTLLVTSMVKYDICWPMRYVRKVKKYLS